MERLEQRITSVELCKIINELRREEKGESAKELRHVDFMTKINKELKTMEKLGMENSLRNFSQSEYTNERGKTYICYSLNASAMRQMLNSESIYVRCKTEEYIKKLENENKLLKEQKSPVKSIEEQTKDCLLQIFNGGVAAIGACKELVNIETKPLKKTIKDQEGLYYS